MKIFSPILMLMMTMSFYCCSSTKDLTPGDEPHSHIVVKSSPSNIQASKFTGIVKDAETGEVMPFVNIILRQSDGSYKASASDLEGRFTIELVPLGEYLLQVISVGYTSAEKSFNIEEYTNFELDVQLDTYDIQVEKPVIYLYPTVEQKVHVQLNYEGDLTHTYPKYPNDGWMVTAEPNGTLWDQKGQEYYALFWEGEPEKQIVPTDGFVVSGEETAAFLEEKLAYLGLNRREANEFIMYWLPRMENNPFNFIHFAGDEYEKQAELVITPKPETSIRVMMLTQPLKTKLNCPLQDLSPLKKERLGFTVVEWGGSMVSSFVEEI